MTSASRRVQAQGETQSERCESRFWEVRGGKVQGRFQADSEQLLGRRVPGGSDELPNDFCFQDTDLLLGIFEFSGNAFFNWFCYCKYFPFVRTQQSQSSSFGKLDYDFRTQFHLLLSNFTPFRHFA